MAQSKFVLPRPIVWVLVALGVLFAIDLFALGAHRELEQASHELDQRLQALELLQAFPRMMLEMQSGLRGFVLTGSPRSLNHYRAVAEQFPDVAAKALSLPGEDEKQRNALEAAVGSARQWLEQYASPLVVKRSAGGGELRVLVTLREFMRKSQGETQAERIRAQFDEAIRQERIRVADAQRTLKRKLDGNSAWMKGRALALLLVLAGLTLMLGRTMARLTGQIRSREVAENATRTTSATLRAISEASPLGILLADVDGACVQANPAFERIAGLPADSVLGTGWQATLHPEDREQVVASWNAAIASGANFESTHRFVHPSGKVVWASMRSATMSDAEALVGYACTIEDVSDRRVAEEALRKSEERLHLALESSRLALFDWHIPSGELFLSREWNALTGYAAQSPPGTARRLNDLIHPQDREELRHAFIEAFKTNKPVSRVAFRIETRSGQWKRLYCSGRVTQRDTLGRAIRLTGTVTAD
jgi:PAS domain S-box-containing protein